MVIVGVIEADRKETDLRGKAGANLSGSLSMRRCRSSCRPTFGGPIRTMGRLRLGWG